MKIKTVVTVTFEISEDLLKQHGFTHDDAINRLKKRNSVLEEVIRDEMGDNLTNVQINIVTAEV